MCTQSGMSGRTGKCKNVAVLVRENFIFALLDLRRMILCCNTTLTRLLALDTIDSAAFRSRYYKSIQYIQNRLQIAVMFFAAPLAWPRRMYRPRSTQASHPPLSQEFRRLTSPVLLPPPGTILKTTKTLQRNIKAGTSPRQLSFHSSTSRPFSGCTLTIRSLVTPSAFIKPLSIPACIPAFIPARLK
jgi:hypothetical protein